EATRVRLPIRTLARPAEAGGRPGMIELIDYRNVDVAEHRWGETRPAFGAAAVHYTREAGRLALAREIDAMVSAPLNKEAMHAARSRRTPSFSGHATAPSTSPSRSTTTRGSWP